MSGFGTPTTIATILTLLRGVNDAGGAPAGDDFLLGCEPCSVGFYSFDDAAEHCTEVHPHVDPGSVGPGLR